MQTALKSVKVAYTFFKFIVTSLWPVFMPNWQTKTRDEVNKLQRFELSSSKLVIFV